LSYIQETLWPPATAGRAAREGRIFRLDALRVGAARISIPKALAAGAFAGLLYAIPFRIMMRLVTTDPVFTIWGTAAVAIYCALVGATAGLLYAGRQRAWRARTRLAPAALCVLLLAAFLFFATPFSVIAGLLVLASSMTGWKPAVRLGLAGFAVAAELATFVLIPIATPSVWGLGADLAGEALLVPLTLALAIPLDLALTKRRDSELRPAPAPETAGPAVVALPAAG